MATRVDPRLYGIPKELQGNPSVRKYFEDLERFLHDLWFRTGGGSDEIAATAIRESYAWDTFSDDVDSGNLSGLYGLEQEFEQAFVYPVEQASKEWRTFTVTGSNYTALDHDFINAKSGAHIVFPEYPCTNAIFAVRNGDGSRITLDGNGKMINRCSTGIIDDEETSIDFYYFIDSDEWFSK